MVKIMKKVDKIFMNSKMMITCGIISAIFYFVGYIPYIFDTDNPAYMFDFVPEMMFSVIIILLLIAFKKGEINIQKALMGALLFYFAQETFSNGFWSIENYFAGWHDEPIISIIFIILGICEYIIFFTHLLLQSDHVGRKTFKINQILSIFLFFALIILDMYYLIKDGFDFIDSSYMLIDLAEPLFIIMIVCMETKIQNYKLIRSSSIQNGTWNAEAKAEARKKFIA